MRLILNTFANKKVVLRETYVTFPINIGIPRRLRTVLPGRSSRQRSGAAHDVHHILQGLTESVAVAIEDGSIVERKHGGMYIDFFRIPQWFYDEVMNGEEWIGKR
jgi:hypothetical protein